MGRPRLTEYLLRLATDADELQRYRDVRDAHDRGTPGYEYFTNDDGPCLSREHVDIILGRESHKVVQAVLDELRTESSRPDESFHGIPVTFIVDVNSRVQTHFLTQ
jgi:hypothetical protein